MAKKSQDYFWAANRDTMVACAMPGFTMWEELQGAARVGIMLPDGSTANAIGRCHDQIDFINRCQSAGYTVLESDDTAQAYGLQLAEILGLKPDNENGRYYLHEGYGSKTAIGLTKSILTLAEKIKKGEKL